MTITPRDWDSRFFGYTVASVSFSTSAELTAGLDQVLEDARREKVRLLYVSCPPLLPSLRAAVERKGLISVGQRVEFIKLLHPGAYELDTDPEIAPSAASSPVLEQLALQSGHHSRFRVDPTFRNREFERLYEKWLASSLRGDNGKCVLVAGDPVAPHGFITLEPGEPAHIGLLAVGAAHRGKGLGRRLVLEAERLCTVQGTFSLWVATQGSNQPARRLYERCGFMQETVVAQFHAWFPE